MRRAWMVLPLSALLACSPSGVTTERQEGWSIYRVPLPADSTVCYTKRVYAGWAIACVYNPAVFRKDSTHA